jgi:hypothetical protein
MNNANAKLVGNAKRDAAAKAAHQTALAARYGVNSSEYARATRIFSNSK